MNPQLQHVEYFFKLWHVESLDVACKLLSCSMWDLVPDQGSNLGPLHWELGVLATGPPGKSQQFLIKDSNLSCRRIPLEKKKIKEFFWPHCEEQAEASKGWMQRGYLEVPHSKPDRDDDDLACEVAVGWRAWIRLVREN